MNRYELKSIVLVLLIVGAVIFNVSNAKAQELPIDSQVIVQTIPSFPLEPLLSTFSGLLLDSIIEYDAFLIAFPDSIPIQLVLDDLLSQIGIVFAQPNYQISIIDPTQISQSFPDQEAPSFLPNQQPTRFYGQPARYTIKGDSAALLATGANVTVAIIDDGIRPDHPLFANRILATGYDFVSDDTDPSEESGLLFGHGTFISGLVSLVAPNCNLLPIRAFDGNGFGTTFTAAEAINWAASHGADVINMSFTQQTPSDLLQLAVQNALDSGLVLIAASGNDSSSVTTYPGAYDAVITVGAIDSLELLADFSNFGTQLDLVAPGIWVYSALAGTYQWGWWSGTSFSAPLVAGIAALVRERNSDLTGSFMSTHLHNAARDSLAWGMLFPPDTLYGFGAADAFLSVLAVVRGDVDGAPSIDIGDITQMINYLFQGGTLTTQIPGQSDTNCDGTTDIGDLTQLIDFLFISLQPIPLCY